MNELHFLGRNSVVNFLIPWFCLLTLCKRTKFGQTMCVVLVLLKKLSSGAESYEISNFYATKKWTVCLLFDKKNRFVGVYGYNSFVV